MKKILFFLLVIAGCTSRQMDVREEISLSGTWQFRIDSLDIGIDKQWQALEFEETVNLPGSMAENGKLIVCSIDMRDMKDDRPASKHLLRSMLAYMNSDSFTPDTKIDLNLVRSLTGR